MKICLHQAYFNDIAKKEKKKKRQLNACTAQ